MLYEVITIVDRIMLSCGTASADFERVQQILSRLPQLYFICIDVANGYAERFVEFVKQRNNFV